MSFSPARIPVIILFFLSINFIFEDAFPQKISKAFEVYKTTRSGEKIYIHLDKSIYHYSDDIWFKIYLTDGLTNLPDTLSHIAYVELINESGSIISSKKVKIENGVGNGDFSLSKDFIEGTYKVRSYTNYLRNFGDEFYYHRDITILNGNLENQNQIKNTGTKEKTSSSLVKISKPFYLDFFPEGGDMVVEVTNPVGFKATNLQGKGIDIAGKIVNTKDEVITTFESYKFGIGSFFFRPIIGEKYRAVVNYENNEWTFDLPKSLTSGYTMRVNNITDGVIKILLKTNIPGGLEDCTLVGQMRGKMILAKDNIKSNKDEAMIMLSSKELPAGILNLTLFGKNNEPYCERLVFVQSFLNIPRLEVTTDKTNYKTRDKVEVLITPDKNNERFYINSSISVTNSKVLGMEKSYADNIVSNLLLTSDLKGNIENPGYYFSEDENKNERKRALDNVMITHGWRRFSWKDVFSENQPTLKYTPEKGFNISGQIVSANRKQDPITSGFVSLALKSKNGISFNQEDTDENGYFKFSYLNIPDSTQVLLTAFENKVKEGRKDSVKMNNKVRILLDKKVDPIVQNKKIEIFEERISSNADTTYFNTLDKISAAYDFKNTILLNEVTIESRLQNKDDPFRASSKLYNEPDSRVILDSIPGAQSAINIFDLLRGRVPGLRVVGNVGDQQVVMRGISSFGGSSVPLYLLNGIPVDSSVAFDILPIDIAYIDILKGTRAAIYGAKGANGVIAIYTRVKDEVKKLDDIDYENRGVLNYVYNGYNKIREFYSPKYDVDKPEFIKPDYRTTLYWNPKIEINQQGQTKLVFFTNDNNNSTFKIEIEGLTDNGMPIQLEKYFYTGKNQ
jgi:TonB-dependent SusC/RagA subfamily outer membrane receptor